MRIAVAGATGNIGSLTTAALERRGHQVVRISRRLGVDLTTGAGLDDALVGVHAVVDATNAPPLDREGTVAHFVTATTNLLAAEARAGVRHHVLLSIAAIERVEGNAHYAGKREQERLVASGPVPWTILPATQFHDFAAMVAGWTEQDGVAELAPPLIQPVAPADVADTLAELVTGAARGRHPTSPVRSDRTSSTWHAGLIRRRDAPWSWCLPGQVCSVSRWPATRCCPAPTR